MKLEKLFVRFMIFLCNKKIIFCYFVYFYNNNRFNNNAFDDETLDLLIAYFNSEGIHLLLLHKIHFTFSFIFFPHFRDINLEKKCREEETSYL